MCTCILGRWPLLRNKVPTWQKVTLVPCSVNLTGKRGKVGHGEVTINNAIIIDVCIYFVLFAQNLDLRYSL